MTGAGGRASRRAPGREDKGYYLQRAEDELERAQAAEHPDAVKAHYTMAEQYLDRVYGPADAQTDE